MAEGCALYADAADCDVWPHCAGPRGCGAVPISPKLAPPARQTAGPGLETGTAAASRDPHPAATALGMVALALAACYLAFLGIAHVRERAPATSIPSASPAHAPGRAAH